jgi:hypothetical protein
VRSNACLRLLPCRRVQSAARDCTQHGPTALYGPSLRGRTQQERARVRCAERRLACTAADQCGNAWCAKSSSRISEIRAATSPKHLE